MIRAARSHLIAPPGQTQSHLPLQPSAPMVGFGRRRRGGWGLTQHRVGNRKTTKISILVNGRRSLAVILLGNRLDRGSLPRAVFANRQDGKSTRENHCVTGELRCKRPWRVNRDEQLGNVGHADVDHRPNKKKPFISSQRKREDHHDQRSAHHGEPQQRIINW